MSSFRERIRKNVPFSTDVYEFTISKWKMRPTKSRIHALISSGQEIKLDLGGADPGNNGWLSVDMTDLCDLYWDLRLGIPFPSESIDQIYSSHLFEHLTFTEGQGLLRESLRVLKPGGSFSICVPNARIYIEGYMSLREVPLEFYGWEPAFNNTTAIDAINYVAYMGGEHKYMFDQENLLHILLEAGLTNVSARAMDPEIDKPERDYESLYAQGFKPEY
jgi:predicted SAM-dependent methyltransferase